MKLYLSRGREKRYMLTRLRPIRATLRGCEIDDLYFDPGDPMAIMGMCEVSAQMLFGQALEPFETIAVTLTGMTNGLPNEIKLGG